MKAISTMAAICNIELTNMSDYISVEKQTAVTSRVIHCIVSPLLILLQNNWG